MKKIYDPEKMKAEVAAEMAARKLCLLYTSTGQVDAKEIHVLAELGDGSHLILSLIHICGP